MPTLRFLFRSSRQLFAFAVAMFLAGCNSIFPQIERPVPDNMELAFEDELGLRTPRPNDRIWRKEYVTMQMYKIDKSYAAYWHDIEAKDTFISFGGDIAQLGLTTAATAIPVTQTTKVLAAAATAVTGAKTTYKQDFLLEKTKETLKIQADKNRDSVEKTILARLNCGADEYPWGMVLADIEQYRSSGTFEAALASVSETVSNAKPAANPSRGKAAPLTVVSSTDTREADRSIKVAGGKLDISFTPDASCPLKAPRRGK